MSNLLLLFSKKVDLAIFDRGFGVFMGEPSSFGNKPITS